MTGFTTLIQHLTSIEDDKWAFPGEMHDESSSDTLETIAESASEASSDHWYPALDENEFYPRTAGVGEVRFAAAIETHLIPHYSSYSKKERRRSWYSAKECDRLAARREKEASRMEAGKPEQKKKCPYRGLELSTETGEAKVLAQIDRVVGAVLTEQWEQRFGGSEDKERIAEVSRALSAATAANALLVAQQDEQEAASIRRASCKEDKQICFWRKQKTANAPASIKKKTASVKKSKKTNKGNRKGESDRSNKKSIDVAHKMKITTVRWWGS